MTIYHARQQAGNSRMECAMRLISAPSRPKAASTFEVITPNGKIYRFPRPGSFARLKFAFRAHADTLALTAALLAILYFAGHLSRAIDANNNAIVCA
jgi:hypothetical protein